MQPCTSAAQTEVSSPQLLVCTFLQVFPLHKQSPAQQPQCQQSMKLFMNCCRSFLCRYNANLLQYFKSCTLENICYCFFFLYCLMLIMLLCCGVALFWLLHIQQCILCKCFFVSWSCLRAVGGEGWEGWGEEIAEVAVGGGGG